MRTTRDLLLSEPWNEDDDGTLTAKFTKIEMNKAGARTSDKWFADMTKSELMNERTLYRRMANDFSSKATAALNKGDSAEAERLLKISEEVSRGALLADRYLNLKEKFSEQNRGETKGHHFKSAKGQTVQVLGNTDHFADLVDHESSSIEFGFGEFVSSMVNGSRNVDVRNALGEGSDSTGGYTVPKRLMAELIDKMRAKTVVVKAGALSVPLDTQQTTIARIASDPAAGWRAENAAIAESDPTFEAVTFIARSLAVLVKVPRELIDDSINMDQALTAAFAGAMAVEIDRVALFGSGTAPEPRGIFNTTNVNSVSMGTNGAQVTNYTKFLDCLYENELDNAADSTAMVLHPRTRRTIEGLVDTTNQPLQPPPSLANLPRLVTTVVPVTQVQGTSGSVCSSAIIGDFTQLLIGIRQDLRIEVLRDLYAANHQYAFVAHLRADIAVAHPESFCKVIGILP